MNPQHTSNSPTALEPDQLTAFREQVKRSRESNKPAWEATRRLVGQAHLQETLSKLTTQIQQSSLPTPLREVLTQSLGHGTVTRLSSLSAEQLKELTGLSATKAVRALCVFFGLVSPANALFSLSPAQVEQHLRESANPYDLLLQADAASLLDLGAGDLTFEEEVVEQYVPQLRQHGNSLILHALDRLQPGSQVGGLYQADQNRTKQLRSYPTAELQFRYWGGVDMLDLAGIKGLLPHYTIVTCHAPATPTFAYEPTRLSQAVITAHLRETKGEFRKVRIEREEALEVHHRDRVLTFPPWKFEIRGPLTLLNLMAQRGKLCILSAIDAEVFWENLAQLLQDDRFRPQDVVFSPANIPEIFGPIYTELSKLPVGERLALSDVADLRQEIPKTLCAQTPHTPIHRFRYVEIRRGAVFEGIPSSQTARQFTRMTEELPPWWLILVPDAAKASG